jgi:hypothetical protein
MAAELVDFSKLTLAQQALLGVQTGLNFYDRYGRNADVDAASAAEDIWDGGGLYTGFPTGAGETISVLSSSANDAAAGTGLRTLRLIGLDTDGNVQIENVTLNGTTPVATTGVFTRINTAYGLTAGSGTTNAGTITIRHTTTTANVFSIIPIGVAKSQVCGFTCPLDKRALVTGVRVAATNNQASAQEVVLGVLTRELSSGVWVNQRSIIAGTTSDPDQVVLAGIPLSSRQDVVIRATGATGDNIAVIAQMDILVLG